MGKVYIGNTGYKLSLGNTKIQRAYLGNVLVYSGDIEVNYYIDPAIVPYHEAIEEGQDCLKPTSFDPKVVRPGFTFVGWRFDTEANPDVIKSLIAGSDNIDLYAVYEKDFTVNYYNGSTSKVSKTYPMYYNNGTITNPHTPAEDTTLKDVSGFKNKLGWTDVVWNSSTSTDKMIQKYPNGADIEVKSDMNLYSVYSNNVTVTVVNGNGGSIDKKIISDIRYRQYNSSEVFTKNPRVYLEHKAVSGWTIDKWCINGDTSKTINIEKNYLTIDTNYDGKTICAMYTQGCTVYTYNGSNSRTTHNLTRTRVCLATGLSTIDPKITLSERSIGTAWKAAGWSRTKQVVSGTSVIGNGSTVTVTASLDNAVFYSIYSYSFSIAVFNYNNAKTNYNLTRYIQYYESTYTKHPKISIAHATASGWSNAGWSITTDKDTTTYIVGDGEVEITDRLSTNLYAMYSQRVKFSVINGYDRNGGYKTDYNELRTVKFCGSTVTINPYITLVHKDFGLGWLNNGWNLGNDNSFSLIGLDKDYPNRTFEVTSTYDNKTIYALYTYPITINWMDSGIVAENKPRYMRALSGSWAATNPTFRRKIKAYSEYTIRGWSRSTAADGAVSYSDNSPITISETTTLYSVLYKTVILTVMEYGRVIPQSSTSYINNGSGNKNIPRFTVQDPTHESRTFLGWSTNGSTTVQYAHYINVETPNTMPLYAIWQQNDQILRDYRNEPNGYKSFYPEGGETFKAKIYRQNLVEIDTNWFDRVKLDIRNNMTNGHWASATWCYVLLFAGPTPDMNNPHAQGQPTYTELRATNWWATGGINTDRGPLANNARATVTATLTPTSGKEQTGISVVSYAYTDDWYIWDARFDIWTITALGKKRVW